MQTWPSPHVPRIPGEGTVVRIRHHATGELRPAAVGPTATLYVCGITPYDATHLGHAATFVAFDLLHRAWLDQGLAVRYASNVTDIDDPLLDRAREIGMDWQELAATQTELFAQDMTALGVIAPHVYLGAVETIPMVADAVRRLLALGLAYRVPLEAGSGGATPELGDVYASLNGAELGRLDRAVMLPLFAERGGDPERPGKRDPLDPALWRRERPGEPAWDGGSLGSGRPGWHIECTVIANWALGPEFDVAGGGRDLCFPHHAMSADHARALGGHGGRHYLHVGMVGYQGEKMSKSLGNLVLVSRLIEDGVEPATIRLAILAHHYAEDWEFTDDLLAAAQDRLDRWRAALSGIGGPAAGPTVAGLREALATDLDAPAALRAVDEWATAALTLGGLDEGAPGVVARAIDALLGVRI